MAPATSRPTTAPAQVPALRASILGGFKGVAVDANENLYVMDPVDSRALVFPNAGSLSGSLTAIAVFGQGGSFMGATILTTTASWPTVSARTLTADLFRMPT